MKLKLGLLFLLGIIVIGCGSMNDNYKTKLDSGLRSKLENKSTEKIQFFGKCTETITDSIKSELEESGVNIQTTTIDIFTATGTVEQIIELAKLDVVKYLEESKENQFHNN